MTTRLSFTKAQVRRAVEGARSAGLAVTAVRIAPDGSIIVHSGDAPPLAPALPTEQDTMPAKKWAF